MSDDHYRWKTNPSDPTSPNYWPSEEPRPPEVPKMRDFEEEYRQPYGNLPAWSVVPLTCAACICFLYAIGDQALAVSLAIAGIVVGGLWLAVSRHIRGRR